MGTALRALRGGTRAGGGAPSGLSPSTWCPPHGEHALRDEAWLWQHGNAPGGDGLRSGTALRDCFYPQRDDWREAGMWRSRQLLRQALEGLAGGAAR